MVRTFLLLGSNTGDREGLLDAAFLRIGLLAGKIIAASSRYETQPWGKEDQPPFLNQAIEVETPLSPQILLATLKDIERSLGRLPSGKWEPRTMDIDIIFYGNLVVEEPNLVIPHPAMAERRFVLTPLAEIAAGIMHPVLNKSVSQLLAACTDPLRVTVAGSAVK